MHTYRQLIGGHWCDAAGGEWIASVSPGTGGPWARVPRGTSGDVDAAVGAARAALRQGPWTQATGGQRGIWLNRWADAVEARLEDLARVEVTDNGRLVREARVQLRHVPRTLRYFAGIADKFEGAVIPVEQPGMFTYTRHEPIGVVAAIVPWNAPLILAVGKLAPALAAGCSVVLKPSEHASASCLELAALAVEAGLPAGALNVVTGFGHEAGAALCAHPGVAKITFTGGEAGGKAIARDAAGRFVDVTLELGGKSANVVFPDADLDAAADGAVAGIFAANGQTCMAGSRLLVHADLHDELVARIVQRVSGARVGPPDDEATDIGPMATEMQYRRVLEFIAIGREEGARCVLGGHALERPGWYVAPTIFTGVAAGMRIAQEEIFGPVLCVMPFRTDQEAVDLANATRFGLAAGVWTSSMERAFGIVGRLDAGTVWINTYRAVSALAPFGGFGSSGMGKELGQQAVHDFLRQKVVWLNHGGRIGNPFVMRV